VSSETIGQRIKRLRLAKGLSQRQLASPGVSYAYISRIEAGGRNPSVKALRKLAEKLNITADYLEFGHEKLGGVYVVAMDPDIVGEENILWAFVHESDADRVVKVLELVEGEGKAWHTFEPIAHDLNDPHFNEYMNARVGTEEWRVHLLDVDEGTEAKEDE